MRSLSFALLTRGPAALALVLALGLPLIGCDKLGLGDKKDDKKEKSKKDKDKDEDDEEDKAAASSTASSTATATAAAATSATAAPVASATTDAPPSASDTAPPPTAQPTAATLPGHTPLPTTEEWAAEKEVTVVGSTKLGCEAKAIREWVRISCKDKNDSGGTPTTVNIDKGGGKGDTFTFASGGVTSLIFPFQDPTEITATFNWTDKSAKFTSYWPKGAPKPPAYGVFDTKASAPVAKAEPPKAEPPKTPSTTAVTVIKRPDEKRANPGRPGLKVPVPLKKPNSR